MVVGSSHGGDGIFHGGGSHKFQCERNNKIHACERNTELMNGKMNGNDGDIFNGGDGGLQRGSYYVFQNSSHNGVFQGGVFQDGGGPGRGYGGGPGRGGYYAGYFGFAGFGDVDYGFSGDKYCEIEYVGNRWCSISDFGVHEEFKPIEYPRWNRWDYNQGRNPIKCPPGATLYEDPGETKQDHSYYVELHDVHYCP